MKFRAWVYRKLIQPFVELLRQGMSPEKIALTIALGVSIGVTPVLGSTTTLCTLAAVALRLNLPAILLVNGVVYPLQLALLIPFLRAGAWLFRAEGPKLTVKQIFSMIRESIPHTVATLWTATMHALVVWLLAACIASSAVYLILLALLRRFWVKPSVVN